MRLFGLFNMKRIENRTGGLVVIVFCIQDRSVRLSYLNAACISELFSNA